MKRTILLLLILSLVSTVAFAGGSQEEATESGLNIAIITSPSGVDDGSFNENNYDGCLAFVANNPGSKVTPLREPSGDGAKIMKLCSDVVADYDVEVCTGFQFGGISTLAMENPETKFILVDVFPADPADPYSTVVLDNVYAMQFAEEESGFFAGVAAALETKSGKVAVVNGVAYPSNVNYQYGFECGVKYVNVMYIKSVEFVELPSLAGVDVTGANVGGNYVGSFSDEATGKVVGNNLIEKGVDILFVAAGGSGNGVFTAVKESHGTCQVIGCDVDQWDDGAISGGNIILTSVLKVMSSNVERVLTEINEGTFVGRNVVLHADTDSTGIVFDDGRQQLSESSKVEIQKAYEKVKAGNMVIASNFGITPEEFVVE